MAPCLGCGFEIDVDGKLQRTGVLSKTPNQPSPTVNLGTNVAGFKYCDPVSLQQWDVPWNCAWGLLDTVNTATGSWDLSQNTLYLSTQSFYTPYRAIKWSGWIRATVPGNATPNQVLLIDLRTVVGGAGSQFYNQLGAAQFGVAGYKTVPFQCTIFGPGLGFGQWPASAGTFSMFFQAVCYNSQLGTGFYIESFSYTVEDIGPGFKVDNGAQGVGPPFFAGSPSYNDNRLYNRWPNPLPF